MKGESLLILHGWGSNSERWQRVKELLEKKGIEVLVLDLPGFGKTLSPQKAWSRDDYINWIFQKVKERNWQKFNLLGHSFGGGLAVKIAATFPERIEKLILLSPAIIQRKSIKTYLFYYISYLGKKVFSLPGFKIFHPLAEKLIYKLAGTKDYYVADGIMKETMKKIGKEEPLEMILEKIKIPTLILWGKKDDVLPIIDAYYIKEKIKGSELKIIPKARHSPHREAPEELAEIIVQFIQS
ncbi:alpha/beta hydrolase [bacterium]|nr:alpha/beta hydrolase [bacterium]